MLLLKTQTECQDCHYANYIPKFLLQEAEGKSFPSFSSSIYKWQNKQYIATWFWKTTKRTGVFWELELSELQSRIFTLIQQVHFVLQLFRIPSKVSRTSLYRRMAKSSSHLIPVVFVFTDSVQWQKSLMLHLGAHHPACPDIQSQTWMQFLPQQQGGLCMPWVRVWHLVQLNLEMPFRFYLSLHWSL